jgi:CRP-like cAMP-binding protein
MDKSITPAHLAVFRSAMEALLPVPDEDFQLLANVLHYKKYNKGEVISKEGEVSRCIWFILKGCFRIYSKEDNHEVNVSFFFENTIASDFISLRHEIPSEFTIEAMEETETLLSFRRDYLPVLNFSKSLIHLTSRFFQQKYFGEVEHSNTFKRMNPEDRYKYLLNHNPKYLQRIPLTYLASYMGMSRKTLTRIRSNMAG